MKHTIDLTHLIVINPRLRPVDTVRIGIPTLNQYTLLGKLIINLALNANNTYAHEITIIDNGGRLQEQNSYERIMESANQHLKIKIETPAYNIGVSCSFNQLIQSLGACIICNDDVIFTDKDVEALLNCSKKNPDAVIVENSDPVSGFSTFYVNRPEVIIQLGGFDELLSPAYFEDNDMRYRLKISGHQIVQVQLPTWQHKTSSTLKQGDDFYKRLHWGNFHRNRKYYILKWGGPPGEEQYLHPFGIT